MKKMVSLLLALVMLAACVSAVAEKYVSDEPVTLKLCVDEVGVAGASYADNLPVYQRIEELTGVTIEWEVIPTDFETVMSTRIASMMELPDILSVNVPNSTLIKSGVIIPLDGLVNENTPNLLRLLEENPDVAPTMYSADGVLYFLPCRMISFEGLAANPITFEVRYDWMQRLGIEDMPETIEDWHELLVAIRDNDPNQNGEADETPFCTTNQYGAKVFASAWGIDWMNDFYLDDEGIVQYAWNTEAARDYLATMRDWYAEGLIAADYLSGRDHWARMLEDNTGVSYWCAASGCDWCNDYNEKNPDTCDWLPVNPPLNVYTGEESFLPVNMTERIALNKLSITTMCENPEIAIKWLDFMFSDEGQRLTNVGIEGESYTLNADGSLNYLPKYWTDTDCWENRKRAGIEPSRYIPHILGDEYFAGMCIPYSERVMERCTPLVDYFRPALPTYSPTAEEDAVLSAVMTDIKTYTEEMINKYIIGTEDLDSFDAFVEKLDSIGLDEVIAIKQEQYERNN